MADILPPLKPIPIKERLSVLYMEYGQLDVLDGAFVVGGLKTGYGRISLVGGCRVFDAGAWHASISRGLRPGCSCRKLLVWIGEAGVRLYSAGQPGGARS